MSDQIITIEEGEGQGYREQQRVLDDLLKLRMQIYEPKVELRPAKDQVLIDSNYRKLKPFELAQQKEQMMSKLTSNSDPAGGLYESEITNQLFGRGIDVLARNQLTIRKMVEIMDPTSEAEKRNFEQAIDRGQFVANFMLEDLQSTPADIKGAVSRRIDEIKKESSSLPQETLQTNQ